MIAFEIVKPEDRELLWNLQQKYLYEMTNYYDDEMDPVGNYHYGYFEAYFTDPARTALLLRSGGDLVGFAMVHPYSNFGGQTDHVLAEFTIFPAFRRRHLAKEAADRILSAFPGRWEIKYHEKNLAARTLWNQVAAPYGPEKRRYAELETVLCFTVE